jgi:cytoskeletal protein RodZ
MYTRTPQPRPKKSYLPLWISGGVVIVVILVVATLEFTNTTHIFHHRKPAVSASSETKGEPSDNRGSSSSVSTNSASPTPSDSTSPVPANDNDKTNGSTSDSTASLIAPSGDFVSAHHVQLDTALSSVCNTTPGANCKITFTNGGTVKSLEQRTVDRGGSTYWDHITPRNIGLSAGTWKVQAVATLGNQTKTADDALTMEISQ